jgi:hypothetical protein
MMSVVDGRVPALRRPMLTSPCPSLETVMPAVPRRGQRPRPNRASANAVPRAQSV